MFYKFFSVLLILLMTLNFNSIYTEEAIVESESDLMQDQIKHVVILMLENRSFDNVMAWLYDESNPPSHFISKDINPTFLGLAYSSLEQYRNVLKDSKGNSVFSSIPIKGVPSVSSTKFINSPKFDPNEEFSNVSIQIMGIEGENRPEMLGFLQDYASIWDEDDWLAQQKEICAVMETYTDKELPIMHGLARHYAVSDQWFSSVPTQTDPNRAFLFCGTSEGNIINATFGKSLFHADTFWNRLVEESPETTWTLFWQANMNPLYSGPYSGTNTFASLNRIPNLHYHFQTFDYFHQLARQGLLPDISFLEPQWTISLNVSPKEKEFVDYFSDGQESVIGYQGNDFHPPGDLRAGEDLLANIYTSLIANKEAWSHTLLIVLFDEHGGLFDHVSPPGAIAPDDKFQNNFKFDRYGVRVPAIFISPLIEKGTVIRSSNPEIPFDHTSLIATLLKWKKIDKSKWNLGHRVDAAPTFENVITLKQPSENYIIGEYVKHDSLIPVHAGDIFYLRDKEGNYLGSSQKEWWHIATAGPIIDKALLEFAYESEKITHGSFSLIRTINPELKTSNLLEILLFPFECIFSNNKHTHSQWWTIKSVDHPFVGSDICYGERVYIENHLYSDLLHFVPSRLCNAQGLFWKYLITKPITDDCSDDHYWIIEQP